MNYINEITAIETLVGEKLADASNIEPVELRDCFASVVALLRKISPLASGTYNIGNVTGDDEMRTVNLPYDVGTSNYRVEGSLVSKGSYFNNDNDVIEMIKDPTSSTFKLCLRDMSANNQSIDFEWAIYPKNS